MVTVGNPGVSHAHCTHCHGSGLRLGRKGALAPCNCVLRGIFRACYSRFVTCATQERHLSRIGFEPQGAGSGPHDVGQKRRRIYRRFLPGLAQNSGRVRIQLIPLPLPAGRGLEIVLPPLGPADGAISSMPSIGSSRNSDESSANWSPTGCIRWMSTSAEPYANRRHEPSRRRSRVLRRCRSISAFRWLREVSREGGVIRAEPNPSGFRRNLASIPRIPRRACLRSPRRDD